MPSEFRVAAVSPAAGAWVAPDFVPQVEFTRPLAPASVGPTDLTLRTREGQPVPGRVTSSANRLRFEPAAPLADGHYVLTPMLEVEAWDGSPMELAAPAPVEFSVRPVAGAWSDPVTLGAAPAAPPMLVADAIGGSSLAWVKDGQVLAAEYDREAGWIPALPVLDIAAFAAPALLLARGAGAVAVAAVEEGGGVVGETLIRLAISRRFDQRGVRVWERPPMIAADLVAPPALHADAAGRLFLILARRAFGRAELRVRWLEAEGRWSEDTISRPAASFTIDGVFTGVRGDLAVAWTETTGPSRSHAVRVFRSAGWDPAVSLAAPPRRGGIGADGNAWLLLPEGPAHSIYLAQDALRWGAARPSIPAGLDELAGRGLDLVQLDWRAAGGIETLLARRYDRAGQLIDEHVLAGPTTAPLRHVLLAGDPEAEVFAVWREGEGIKFARASREPAGGLSWSSAEWWHDDHAPVPIERAHLTAMGRRVGVTWVEGGRLASSFLGGPSLMPRAAINPRLPASATPLASEMFAGTALGSLLVVWQEDATLRAQALQ